MIRILITSFLIILTQSSCVKELSISPEEAKPVNGMLYIDSNPQGAEIYLDGKNTGDITPDTIFWLQEKTYQIVLKKTLFKDTTTYLKVTADQVTSRFFDYTTNPNMRGSFYLESNPSNADIFIGDSATGQRTPGTVSNLYPGEYEIQVKKSGCWPEKIKVLIESVRTKHYFTTLADTSVWVVYNKKNINIPSESIRYVAIEKGWIKWLASFGAGVIKFDDKEFMVYDIENSPLPSNNVNMVHIDKSNRKWFCTDQGLAMFDDHTWYVYTAGNSGLPESWVTSVLVDEIGDIWAGTRNSGLARFDGSQWIIYNTGNSKLPSDAINMIYQGPSNSKWIGTFGGGLVLINNNFQWSIYDVQSTIRPGIPPKPGFPTNNITGISIAADGLKWVSFASIRGEPGGSAYSRFNYWNRLLNLPSPDVLFLITDKTNVVWFGTFDEGITRYQQGAWANFDKSNSPMPSNIVYSIAIDGNNHKWIATLGGGLVKYKKN
jgi:ligand-binding sensor domain-containing protein